MRGLIYAGSGGLGWLKRFFLDTDPYLLKIVNKPLLEYFLDLASILKVSELRLVSDHSTRGMEESFGDGSRWGIKLSYALAKPGDSLKNVYLKNLSFCKNQDLLLFNGFFFVNYDRRELDAIVKGKHSFYLGEEQKRIICLKADCALGDSSSVGIEKMPGLSISEIKTVMDYYRLNMSILKHWNKFYVLPGYSNQKDTFLGLNLIYPNSSELVPPIMIGDNCSFNKFTIIGPNSIIGDNVIVDDNTVVKDSIILDNTFIGAELDIDSKIVCKNHLIDGKTGDMIVVHDRILVSQVEQGLVVSYFNYMIQKVLSVIFLLAQLPFWLLFFIGYSIVIRKQRSSWLINKGFKTIDYLGPARLSQSLWGRFLLRLSLDKFCLLWHVLRGKLILVGNSLMPNSAAHRKLVLDLPVYTPGVFSLAETVEITSSDELVFYELEYVHNVSTRFNLKIVVRCLIRRLIKGYRG